MNCPVITCTKGTLLFDGAMVTFELFREIREYVDACLVPNNLPERWEARCTTNIDLLEALVLELDRVIPWFTTGEEAESIAVIPPPPRKPTRVVRPPGYVDGELSDDSIEWIAHREYVEQFEKWQNEVYLPWRESFPKDGSSKEEIQKYWQAKPVPPSENGRLSSLRLERRKLINNYLREREKANELQRLLDAYYRDLPEMKRRNDIHRKTEVLRQKFGNKKQIVSRMLRDLRAAREMGGIVHETVPWVILASGEAIFEKVNIWFDVLCKRYPDLRWERSRLDFFRQFSPIRVIKGEKDFAGYFVFIFEQVDFAVLECPIVGNAIYLLKGDWKWLSKLSKKQLLDRQQAERIIHSRDGRWKNVLCEKLRMRK